MKTKSKDIYKLYIISDLYLYEKRKIENKSGFGVGQFYDFVAIYFCHMYMMEL